MNAYFHLTRNGQISLFPYSRARTRISSADQVIGKLEITDQTSNLLRIWTEISINTRGDLFATHLTTDGGSLYFRIMKIDVAQGRSLAVWNVWKAGIVFVGSMAVDSQGNVYATDRAKT